MTDQDQNRAFPAYINCSLCPAQASKSGPVIEVSPELFIQGYKCPCKHRTYAPETVQ